MSAAARTAALKAAFRGADASVSVYGADVRLSVLRCSQTVADAARRWAWSASDEPGTARRWGTHAAHALLYSTFLSGEERVIARCGGAYVEVIAVGEVRGFVGGAGAGALSAADALHVEKVIYNAAVPHVSSVPSVGDAHVDWQRFYSSSEQVPTFSVVEVDAAVGGFGGGGSEGQLLAPPPFVGGLIVQALPPREGADGARGAEGVARVRALWESGELPPLDSIAGAREGPVEFLRHVAGAAALTLPSDDAAVARRRVGFYCRCTTAGFAARLGALGTETLVEMRDDGGCALTCEMCNEPHHVSADVLDALVTAQVTA
jgi:redox-regulated HSP33 family molecular chaperone